LTTTENGAPVSYLLYGNRSRGDLMKGGFGGLRRSVARRQVESATKETLGTIKRMLEQTPPARTVCAPLTTFLPSFLMSQFGRRLRIPI
jgi:hypothetical protein